MSDAEPTAQHPVESTTEPSPQERAAAQTRLRDHLFGLKSVAAVGLAGVILGGLAGFGIHAATDGGGREDRMGRFGPGGGFQGGPGGRGGQGFPQGPGQQGPGQQGPGGQLPGGQLPGGQAPPAPSQAPSQDS